MRILFLSDNFPPETNAAATRVYERAVYWARWGHEVTIMTCHPNFPQGKLHEGYRNDWHQVSQMDGLKIVRVKTFIAANRGTFLRILDFVSFMITGTVAALFEPKPDVVVSSSPQFFTAVAGWMVSVLRRVPFVFELADIWPASIAAVGVMKRSLAFRALEAFELFLYRQSKAVVALTQAFKDNLIGRGIEANKIAVVINGVDLERYAPLPRDLELERQWGLEPHRFTIGYVGTHGMAHDLMNVVRAAHLLKDRQDILFLLVGDGAERPMIMAEAERLGLTNIRFQGPQPKAMMPRIWSLLDVALVHLKDSDTFREVIPSKIFEAMGMGLPLLLVAPQGEASAIIDATQAGLNVLAGQPEQLAKAASTMADDRALTAQLAAKSLSSAPHYSRQTQAEKMIAVLESVKQ